MSTQPSTIDFVEPAFVPNVAEATAIRGSADSTALTSCIRPSPSEIEFYSKYPWCLNAFPRFQEVVAHLSAELHKFDEEHHNWQQTELINNIFLLACGLTDTADDFLAGDTYDFSKLRRALPPTGLVVDAAEKVLRSTSRLRVARFAEVQRWRSLWASAITDFLQQYLAVSGLDRSVLLPYCSRLLELLEVEFPEPLLNQRCKLPAFFRSRDFAPQDCIELGRKLVESFAGSDRPVIVMGLRTAGSFLAPLLCAYLRSRSIRANWVAVRPKKGMAAWEQRPLMDAARAKANAVIIDESIHTGDTLVKAVRLLNRAGFPNREVTVLNPVEPAYPHWRNSRALASLADVQFITLEPDERYKQKLLDEGVGADLITNYFLASGYTRAEVVSSAEIDTINGKWRQPPERVDVRLKRIYEVRLRNAAGAEEVRYVLAKSVGWGWLGYHAFIAAYKLDGFVPPLVGLRDGILFTEWLPQTQDGARPYLRRESLIDFLASYIAKRSENLMLSSDPTLDLVRDRRHKGCEVLASFLSRAYGSRIVKALKRSHIQRQLACQPVPNAVMTDSKMSPEELIARGAAFLKTDFEHHAQGKNELGMTDPAYDLASAIFHFKLSPQESAQLVNQYVSRTGDTSVEERLYFNKLVVGLWTQNLATLGLYTSRLFARRDEFHQSYISAWNFLVQETIRECGKFCQRPQKLEWRAPLLVADIDGVLDRMVFGFPCTTAAGVKALSLLHAHGVTVAANTARTLQEVKHYSAAYGMAGGVAEYGSVVWDAISDREIVMVTPESLRQLERVKNALKEIPGVFLNDDYQYSLRAFTYQNDHTAPLPPLLAQDVLAKLNADRLAIHHTGLDTAIVAKETNKGTGLLALLAVVGIPAPNAMAIGDSEPDLAMFRVVGRSFAPGNISCRREAAAVRCHVAKANYQPGLLESVRKIVHPDSSRCAKCMAVEESWPARGKSLLADLLSAADQKPLSLLMRNLRSASPLEIFRT